MLTFLGVRLRLRRTWIRFKTQICTKINLGEWEAFDDLVLGVLSLSGLVHIRVIPMLVLLKICEHSERKIL